MNDPSSASGSRGAVSSGDRLITAGRVEDDAQYEAGLRPRSLDEYIGQDRVRDNLEVSIAAAVAASTVRVVAPAAASAAR